MKRKFAFKSLLSLVMAGTLFCGSAISAFAEDIGNYEVKKPDNSTTIQTIAEHYQPTIHMVQYFSLLTLQL